VALNISGFSSKIFSWIITPLFWLFLLIFFIVGVLMILYIRRWKRYVYPTIEVVDLGNGKLGFNKLKSGWFGKKTYLRGLWWTGEDVLRTNQGDRIENFSTKDFQEVDGTRGVVCFRNQLRQNILVPISQLKLENEELIADIAPADYTDVAVDIVKDAAKETSDWRDKLIQFGQWALVIIFSLVIDYYLQILPRFQYIRSNFDINSKRLSSLDLGLERPVSDKRLALPTEAFY